MKTIPFNKPYISGKEFTYMQETADRGHLSGNGHYTKLCHSFFEKNYGFKKCFLTTSCTDALEMAVILIDIKPGDEVIIPSYTYVSTALAFARGGAKIVFADSRKDHPNMDEAQLEALITPKTKAIVPVHYAGNACEMDSIMGLAEKHGLWVIEDDALSIDSYYNGKALGSIGHMGCFSFHETKNIQCGEGGMLAINDERLIKRAEVIWEKGTNRAEFFRGDVNKYGWVDTGSSFLPSEMLAAFLYAQLENLEEIQTKRLALWNAYDSHLQELANKSFFSIPKIPEYATNNAHAYYIICNTSDERSKLLALLKENGITATFHYQSLHKSGYYIDKHEGEQLSNADHFSDCLLRLPLYYEMGDEDVLKITNHIKTYYL